ncbi:MAG: sugar kinase [Candidatus Glassbacteria bacterium RBG_16_58_8]|uniref:Sugar kinase n=1 Tax=Candidatus Glassbacteria bacterium RBG_16_58_8 TaxID=1817866 RepID=A0A1F5YCN5_9BACT|nr:MAG: sugar kinase [Candidatus Glassbacteria bacterium RBG_16_58_8]
MAIVCVGSIALDTVKTPFGKVREKLGGSATYFSMAASFFAPVSVVAVIGSDLKDAKLAPLKARGIDLSGIERRKGKTFRWSGEYSYDLNVRETIETHLNVFEEFDPVIREELRGFPFVFLGNIDPDLQHRILDQMISPRLVVTDTMNYWISGKRDSLIKLLSRVDILVINDAEARELSGEYNLLASARWIIDQGPQTVIIKKGEHGALMFRGRSFFSAPGFPLDAVFDPTGAGDSFAGGFVGYLAKTEDLSEDNLRRAVIYGSTLASFTVEEFGVDKLIELATDDIEARVRNFRELTHFDL